MASYRLTKRADRKLEAVYRYTLENFGPGQADDYFRALEEVFETLSKRPQLGRRFHEYRRFEHEAHVIFYRPRRGSILIVDIFHRREDANKLRASRRR